ncbi:hypothetical protein CDL15_Pgr000762 [Punica granatum]|uniref:Uncharacterized protein n=1 Tax=Punica granatum TaxID=22663 RepID=A0A218W4T1_PUNGR|nr:hypothetical protein CDL15_Pgr000762 [Punica granatum]
MCSLPYPLSPLSESPVTFTKFDQKLHPVEEFSTHPSSPARFQDAKTKESEGSMSEITWLRGSCGGQSSNSNRHRYEGEVDPFHIYLQTIPRSMLMRRNAEWKRRKPITRNIGELQEVGTPHHIF